MFHTQYTERVRVATVNEEDSLTHQSFKEAVDVNNIIKAHRRSGMPLPSAGINLGDVTGIQDYRSALDDVMAVQEVFNKLPAASRSYFENDPANFLDWSMHQEAAVIDSLVEGPPKPPEVVTDPPPPPPPPAAEEGPPPPA